MFCVPLNKVLAVFSVIYGMGWKSKSGKNRLNSIKMPAVMNNHMVVITGAVERNFTK
jgi:hypothetical protein